MLYGVLPRDFLCSFQILIGVNGQEMQGTIVRIRSPPNNLETIFVIGTHMPKAVCASLKKFKEIFYNDSKKAMRKRG